MSRFERVVAPTNVRPVCPAAALVAEAEGGTGCVCRVTLDLIASAQNPSTLSRWCFNSDALAGYQTCPTWRADREAEWAAKARLPLLDGKGDLRAGHPEDRQRNRGLEMALDAQERDRWLSARESS